MATIPGNLDDLLQRGYRFALSLTHDAARAEADHPLKKT